MTDTADIAGRLRRLAKQKPNTYSLGQKVGKADISKFEARYRISLPDDYREFLLAVGEGASGPDYGLMTLDGGMKQRGQTIYELADPFPEPKDTTDYLDFGVGGILPIQYSGCTYYAGLVTTGPARGQVWFTTEERPGWLPHARGLLVDAKGKPFKKKGADEAPFFEALLAPRNAKLRLGFAAWYSEWLDGVERAS